MGSALFAFATFKVNVCSWVSKNVCSEVQLSPSHKWTEVDLQMLFGNPTQELALFLFFLKSLL